MSDEHEDQDELQQVLFNLDEEEKKEKERIDAQRKIILLGVFPAHIVEWVKGKKYDGNTPYNPKFKIAEEAANFEGEDSLTGERKKGDVFVGQRVDGRGIWFCPGTGEKNSNLRHFRFAEAIGHKFKTKDGNYILTPLKEEDVLGKAVMVNIQLETTKETRNLPPAERKRFPKVFNIQTWEDGKDMPLEDVLSLPDF